MSVTVGVLGESGRIPILSGTENWPAFENNLEGQLRIHGWWEILTGDDPKPQAEDFEKKDNYRKELRTWMTVQSKLTGILQLSIDTHIKQRLDQYRDEHRSELGEWTATDQYKVLKKLLGVQGFIARRPIAEVIIGANLSAYSSVKDYGNAILEANKRLTELGEPIPEWLVSNCFLKGLGRAYNNWVDVVLAEYSTNPVGADNKMRYPKVQDMVASLLDREITREGGQGLEYKALHTNRNRSNNRRGWNSVACTACKGQHSKEDCWVRNEETWNNSAPDWMKEKYSTWQEAQRDRKRLNERRNNGNPNPKQDNQGQDEKGLLAVALLAKDKVSKAMDGAWYLDNGSSYHISNDRSLFTTPLDTRRKVQITTVGGDRVASQGVGVASIPIQVGGRQGMLNLSDVNYCPDAQHNLMSIGMLERKGCTYQAGNGKLSLYRSTGELALEAVRTDSNLYALVQDKAKAIKSYSSKANAANKKKAPEQKWIRLPFPSEEEVDDDSDDEDEPPAQTQIAPPKDEDESTGHNSTEPSNNAVGEKPRQPLQETGRPKRSNNRLDYKKFHEGKGEPR